jgi:hypothetical protein
MGQVQQAAGRLATRVIVPETINYSYDTPRVGAGYRVLRPQPRGVGRSTAALTGVVFDDFGDDLAQVIDQLGDACRGARPCVRQRRRSQPGHQSDPADQERLAALRLAFFAPGHDASIWLTGWYPHTLKMQVTAVEGLDAERYSGAGNAPTLEITAVSLTRVVGRPSCPAWSSRHHHFLSKTPATPCFPNNLRRLREP